MIKFAVSVFVFLLALGSVGFPARGAGEPTTFRFDFGTGPTKPGSVRVAPAAVYTPETGYGFENAPALTPSAHGVTSDKPFFFSVKVPAGNYNVTATLSGGPAGSTTTIKAEARRLMVEQAPTAPDKPEVRTFTVNVRTPGGPLNPHEAVPRVSLRWDDKLTLEFNGNHPCLGTLEIVRADTAVTVFLAGDSTVTEQPGEPWAGWGQMLPRFFQPGVAVSDHAESGRSLVSFRGEQRFARILRELKRGDYVFIQFGHNDQKEKGEGVGPFTTYKQHLKEYIQEIRKLGGNVVLVTPMERRRWDGDKPLPTLAEFAEAVRQVGHEDNAPVIDLNAMSLKLYEALGPQESTKAFVHYPAGTYPGQDKELKDDTHHNAYGGYELARCIVEGIKAQVPALAKSLVPGLPTFDPTHPDPAVTFDVPPSPVSSTEKPAGS